MQLSLVTVAFDPATGGFPPRPLDSIEGEVVSVVEHFFTYLDRPHLLLVVHHDSRAPRSAADPAGARSARRDQLATQLAALTPDQRRTFDRLRAWRQGRAEADGVPVYVVFTNQHLLEIVRRRPVTRADLGNVRGIGTAKLGRYGDDLLAVLGDAGTRPRESGRATA